MEELWLLCVLKQLIEVSIGVWLGSRDALLHARNFAADCRFFELHRCNTWTNNETTTCNAISRYFAKSSMVLCYCLYSPWHVKGLAFQNNVAELDYDLDVLRLKAMVGSVHVQFR